ncbi:MAG: Lrp/AsnC family transcriptional regulator, leucine-responsive regulatory protein [Desulfomicrobiaceae bacterium]|jgi:Lrp/AsnC family leucine-responsive transcriptional regulator|nr:Lrp/AsnC family transcriptional regulator [Desulfomicrobiaceae bacterium]MDI3493265.1 Lrp/AsnC family transcriptional regulator, leucine-responsive regulatory protein [Desulfomicrobiaceae bacterium]MDK2873335.1 Lrp/AsnC family transcriptional regulator, leucine-responsive regulatory protein [Desulfomicrobiaceae bacterium]
MLDEIDVQILNLLQENAKITNAELARRIGMAPSGALERVRKLESRGIITGASVRLDPHRLGLTLSTFVLIKTNEPVGSSAIGHALAAIPEVLEVHWTAGEYNYLIKARVRDTEDQVALMKKLGAIPGVQDSRTTLVLETIKETQSLCLDHIPVKGGRKNSKNGG